MWVGEIGRQPGGRGTLCGGWRAGDSGQGALAEPRAAHRTRYVVLRTTNHRYVDDYHRNITSHCFFQGTNALKTLALLYFIPDLLTFLSFKRQM